MILHALKTYIAKIIFNKMILDFLRSNIINIIIFIIIIYFFLLRNIIFKKLNLRSEIRSLIINSIIIFLIVILANRISPESSKWILSSIIIVIGLAIQDFILSIISFFILIILQPIKTNDFVSLQEEVGTIKNINMLNTELETINGETIIFPNSKILKEKIINISKNGFYIANIKLNLDYSSDLEAVKKKIESIVETIEGVDKDKTFRSKLAFFSIVEFGDSSIKIKLRLVINWKVYNKTYTTFFNLINKEANKNDSVIIFNYPKLDVNLNSN